MRTDKVGILAAAVLGAISLGACGAGTHHGSTGTAAASSTPASGGAGLVAGSSGTNGATSGTSATSTTTASHSAAPSSSSSAHVRARSPRSQPPPTPTGGPGAVKAAKHDGGAAIAPVANPAAPGGGARGGGARNVPQAELLTLRPGGGLTPTSLASASAGPIELRVVSDDAHARRIVLRAGSPQTLTVPAHGRASMLVSGLGPGRYVLEVDGRARAALLIGS